MWRAFEEQLRGTQAKDGTRGPSAKPSWLKENQGQTLLPSGSLKEREHGHWFAGASSLKEVISQFGALASSS